MSETIAIREPGHSHSQAAETTSSETNLTERHASGAAVKPTNWRRRVIGALMSSLALGAFALALLTYVEMQAVGWASGVMLSACALACWSPRVERLLLGTATWPQAIGWLLAGLPWSIILAGFLLKGTRGTQPSVVVGVVALVALYLFRASRPGHHVRIGGRSSRVWAGLVAIALAGVFGEFAASSAARHTERTLGDTADMLSGMIFLLPALAYALNALGLFDLSLLIRGLPLPALGTKPPLRWLETHDEAFHAGMTVAGIAWLIAALLAAEALTSTVRLNAGGTAFLTIVLILLPSYLVLVLVGSGYAKGLVSRTLAGAAVDTDVRTQLLTRLRPGLWLILGVSALWWTSIYGLAVATSAGPAANLATWIGARVPSIANELSASPALDVRAQALAVARGASTQARASIQAVKDTLGTRGPLSLIDARVDSDYALRWMEEFADSVSRGEPDFYLLNLSIYDTSIDPGAEWRESIAEMSASSTAERELVIRAADEYTAAHDAWVAWWALEGSGTRALAHAQTLAILVVAFAAILVHYLLLLELPFWYGQRCWKTEQCALSARELRAAEQRIRDRVAGRDQSDRDAGELGLAYSLAKDQVQRTRDIPMHTFHSARDLFGKLGRAGIGALLTTALGPTGGQLLKALGL